MALLFVDSFDHYPQAALPAKWTGAAFPNLTPGVYSGTGYDILAARGRCGTAALHMGRAAEVYRGVAFGSSTVVIGFAFYLNAADTDPGRDFTFLTINNASGDGWLSALSYFADGSLALQTGLGSGAVVVGQTPPALIYMDVWYFLEWKVTYHASAGAMTLRVNNVPQITAAGLDTVTAGAGGAPRLIYFRSPAGGGGQIYFVDDLYALDDTGAAPGNDFLGDSRVEYLRPRAAGASQAWTPVGFASHWEPVDDDRTPDDDGSYVEASTAALTDTNRYQPTGLPSGPIFGAQLSLSARKTEAGPRVIAPVANGISGPSIGPSVDTYQYYTTPYATNPATGLAWTIAAINAAEFGVTVVS